jgi:hypothetical protein
MINIAKVRRQTELDRNARLYGNDDSGVSQQAFSKARQQIRWETCRTLTDLTNGAIYEKGYSTWNGYGISATDGSKAQLPFDEKLHEKFGTVGRNSTANTA